jgi:hypothetical protein
MAELFVATMPGEHGFAKQVVIKRLLPHLIHEPGYVAMFIDEAKLTAKLVHPKIAQTHELGRVEDQLYIAMEYIEGIDVLAMLRECAHRRERVDPGIAAWVVQEVLDALDYAHHLKADDESPMGIVHRDISPSNVLMSVRGDVKLVDFGIARARGPGRAHKTKSGTLKGKYGYMSPEQVLEQPLDHRSDLFSVGVVLAEMLTGRRLFAAANELDVLLMVRDAKLNRLDKYGAEIHPALDEIVRRALRKPLDERWQTAAAFRDALGEWLFEQRRRVSAREVSDVVRSLRDAVSARQRATTVPDDTSTALIEGEGVRGRPRTAPPVQFGIPDGLAIPGGVGSIPEAILEIGDSMPVISVSYDEQLAEGSVPQGPRPPTSPGFGEIPPPPAVGRAQTPRGGTQPMGSLAKPPASISTNAAPNLDLGLGPFTAQEAQQAIDSAIPSEIGQTQPEMSARYPSIEAAIESLMPLDADPSARDFDESPVETEERSSTIKLPSPSDVARRKPPTPPTIADIADEPDDAGEFATTPPLRVLFRLMTARSTGLLVVSVGGIKKEIYVRDGQPEFVSSNMASELFGNYLITKGVLSDGELAMALAMMPHYGGKLGDTLVGLGLLKPLEVFRHLTRQVRTKLIDVCSWTKGSFGWYSGRENPREAFPLDLNTYEVLGAGAMGLPNDTIEVWLEENRMKKLKANKSRRIGPERFEVKQLVELYDRLDGKRSIGQLTEIAGPDKLRVARMLYLLECCDLAKE